MHASYSLLGLGVVLSLASPVVAGGDGKIWTKAEKELPDWALKNTLQLNLSADSTNYAVFPLTEELVHGNTNEEESLGIKGNLKNVQDTNYNDFRGDGDVAYMSCDEPEDDTYIDPNMMLNELIKQTPKAIILFSTSCLCCSIHYDGELPYTNFLSMTDPAEAMTILNHLTDMEKGEVVNVYIHGNTTNLSPGKGSKDGSGKKSGVAMSVLYSITGLITLLFLIIITTGAVRAHRYPERYGPRRGADGGPRQSRAKGLARAVLETLPIVKFGHRQQPKPDPDLEMETATTEGQYPAAQRAVPHVEDTRSALSSRLSMSGSEATGTSVVGSDPRDEDLGCSICTEDFKVGEDVRVLPCNHQYHPNCVDPWLINISGTCPLCRLDLRPGRGDSQDSVDGETSLPPPLGWEMDDNETVQNSYRNRLSRLFDINRLRQASVEEQMQALRQLREDGIGQETRESETSIPREDEDRHQGARFADKLKERFRILTKPQSAQRQTS